MTDELSRFSSLGAPTMLPGNCFICGGISGPFIDTQRTINRTGRLYICVSCVSEMARVLGVIQVSEPHICEDRTDEYRSIADDLVRGFAAIEPLFDSLGPVSLAEDSAGESGSNEGASGDDAAISAGAERDDSPADDDVSVEDDGGLSKYTLDGGRIRK